MHFAQRGCVRCRFAETSPMHLSPTRSHTQRGWRSLTCASPRFNCARSSERQPREAMICIFHLAAERRVETALQKFVKGGSLNEIWPAVNRQAMHSLGQRAQRAACRCIY
eukprot:6177918-Pleurochrysis_carterae.AAC.2